jgi:broad specificity phosphatase PhoE
VGCVDVAAALYLIRHGETQWSLDGRHTGRTELALTPHGESQARRVGLLLQGVVFSQVLVSPRQRARRTCELAGLGAQAQVDECLSEWDYGVYEGQTRAQIQAQRPHWDVFQDGCPGGESVEQLQQRVDRVRDGLRRAGGRIALFSHGHFLRALGVRWLDQPLPLGRHLGLDAGSLSVLNFEHDDGVTPMIQLWNSLPTEH